jgi:hypothetical protein
VPTRREFLTGLAVTPLAAYLPVLEPDLTVRAEIWPEDHCLSAESALGFRQLLASVAGDGSVSSRASASLIIVPGVRQLSFASGATLLERMHLGAWVIFESGLGFSTEAKYRRQAEVCERIFDLKLLPPIKVTKHLARTAYIEYFRPIGCLVRTFEAVTPVCCDRSEVVAKFASYTVCTRKTIGCGGLIYLGSMLGPGLFAEEREAVKVGSALVAAGRNVAAIVQRGSFLIRPGLLSRDSR